MGIAGFIGQEGLAAGVETMTIANGIKCFWNSLILGNKLFLLFIFVMLLVLFVSESRGKKKHGWNIES